MFDINGGELVVLALLAALLLGPDRLPDLARQAAGLVRKGRDFAKVAQAQMREEIGPEFDEVDWKRYDPRQYHPRRIVQNALSDTFDDGSTPKRTTTRSGSSAAKPVSANAMTGTSQTGTSQTGTSQTGTFQTGTSQTGTRASGSTAPGVSVRKPVGNAGTPQRPSPAPATWGDAARLAGLDDDAT